MVGWESVRIFSVGVVLFESVDRCFNSSSVHAWCLAVVLVWLRSGSSCFCTSTPQVA